MNFLSKRPSYRFLQPNKEDVFPTKLSDPISGEQYKYSFIRLLLLPRLFRQHAIKLSSLFIGRSYLQISLSQNRKS